MTENAIPTKAEILAELHSSWEKLQAYLKQHTETQLTVPVDAVGWTVKDHLSHLMAWEAGIVALLHKQSRAAAMGLDDALLHSDDYDKSNAVVRQQYHDKSLSEILQMLEQEHQRLVTTLEGMTDADLLRPYRDYAPESDRDAPVVHWIGGNSFEHYTEHLPWIAAITDQG